MKRSCQLSAVSCQLAVFAALLAPGVAAATVPDQFGTGRTMGMGGGGVAVTSDGDAALFDPAGLFQIRRPTVSMGLSAAFSRFDPVPDLYWDTNRDGELNDLDAPLHYDANVDPAIGVHLAAGRNVGGKFAVGVSAYVPTARLIRFETFEPSLPDYFMYDNRTQRYVMAAGFGGRIWKGLSVGASVDFVPHAKYKLDMTLDAEIVGTTDENGDVQDMIGDVTVDVHSMDLDLVPGFAPILGFQLDAGRFVKALDGLWIAGTYHGSVGLPISVDLDLQTNLKASDVGSMDPFVFAAILGAGLQLYDHYQPAQWSLGLAYRSNEVLTAYVDMRYTDWRPMILNVAKVTTATVTSPLVDLNGLVHDGNGYNVGLRQVISWRAGSELRLPQWTLDNDWKYVRLVVRGGFGYEPTPLLGQGESSELLDANRMMFTLGMGGETWDRFHLVDGPVRLDLYGQYHVLASGELTRHADEPTPGYPVATDTIPIGGNIVVVGASWGFDY